MQMTKGDICKSYKEAKRKKAQVQILAELNQVTPEYVKEILKEGGVWQTPGPKPKTKLKAKAAIINPDFEEVVNEMIEQSKEQQKQDALIEAAHFGLEFMDAKIIEMEHFMDELQKELDKMRATRERTREVLGVQSAI